MAAPGFSRASLLVFPLFFPSLCCFFHFTSPHLSDEALHQARPVATIPRAGDRTGSPRSVHGAVGRSVGRSWTGSPRAVHWAVHWSTYVVDRSVNKWISKKKKRAVHWAVHWASWTGSPTRWQAEGWTARPSPWTYALRSVWYTVGVEGVPSIARGIYMVRKTRIGCRAVS